MKGIKCIPSNGTIYSPEDLFSCSALLSVGIPILIGKFLPYDLTDSSIEKVL
jgi:hypothetical protein